MYSFEELEQKCKRYHLKKKLLPFVIVVLLGVLSYFGLQNYSFEMKSFTKESNNSFASSSSFISSSSVSSLSQTKQKRKKRVKRCFGVQVMYVHENYLPQLLKKKKEMEKLGLACHINYGKLLANKQRQLFLVCATKKSKKQLAAVTTLLQHHSIEYVIVRDSCKYLTKATITQKRVASSSSSLAVKTPMPITDNIIETKEVSLEQLQKLYEARKSYEVAMKIAQLFYAQGAYEAALQWAKRANRLNRTKEAAWILYAKALHKLGYSKKAKQLLKVFLDYQDSNEAKELLKKWQ